MNLSEKIYACRKRSGLSQEALAERLGVSRQAVSKWETGDAEPELSKLRLLADAFGVTADWLLSAEGMPEPEAAAPQDAPTPLDVQSAPASTAGDWLEAIPGFVGRMLRRYGWLFGVYLMIAGLGLTIFGGVAASIAGGMERSFNNATDQMGFGSFGNSTEIIWYDENGNAMDSAPFGITDETAAELFGSPFSGHASPEFFNPVVALGKFMAVIGILLMIGGGVLAVVLKKHARKQ